MRNAKAIVVFAAALNTAQGWCESPPIRQGDLPPIAPGEAKTMSIKDLPPAAQASIGGSAASARKAHTTVEGVSYTELGATPQAVSMLERFAARSRKALDERHKQSSAPVPLPAQFASTAQFVGFIEEPGTSGSLTRLSRLYRLDGKTIMLTEWDYPTDGGGVVQIAEYVNTSVKGTPAVLTVQTAESAALWCLSWATASKDYTFYVHEPRLAESTAAFILDFASSVSK